MRSENWYSSAIMATAILSCSTDLLLNLVVHGVSISGLNLWIDYARSIIIVARSTVQFHSEIPDALARAVRGNYI